MKLTPLLTGAVILSLSVSTSWADNKDPKEVKDPKEMTQTQQLESDAGFYVGIYGGSEFASNYVNKNEAVRGGFGSTGTGTSGTNDFFGGVGGIKAGYNFQSWRICDSYSLRWQPAIEAEALYLGTHSSDSFGGNGIAANTRTNYNSAAWFVNGIVRIKNSSPVTPYFGIGVGGEYLTSSTDINTNVPGQSHITGVHGDDVVFAAQALGGFDYALNKHWALFGEYKFIDALNPNLGGNGGGGSHYSYNPDQIQQHVVVAGVKYNF
jgi:opacity protein-like surface antigen